MISSEYVEFVNSHTSEIAAYVNECFSLSKDYIRVKLIRKIKEYITPLPIHYVWQEDDWNPYDCSGKIVQEGLISLNQTVDEFLENEYSGNKEATYISGMGFSYNTYGDELHYDIIEIAYEIMICSIRRYIEQAFNILLTDEDLEDISIECREFDDIYDDCIASDFFSYESAVEFVGIGGMKLSELGKKDLKLFTKS